MKIEIDSFGEFFNSNVIENPQSEEVVYSSKEIVLKNEKKIMIKFNCNVIKGYSYVNINGLFDLPQGAEACFEVIPNQKINLKLIVGRNSKLEFDNIEIAEANNKNLTFLEKKKMLVIVPSYPTTFSNINHKIHELNKEYVNNGIELQVASINSEKWYEMKYTFDKIEIIEGNYSTLKDLLIYEDYKAVMVYSVNEELLQILEGYTNFEQQLIFKVGSNELLDCFNSSNYRKRYFTGKSYKNYTMANNKSKIIECFANRDNATWIFQSNRLFDFYNNLYTFKNSQVIEDIEPVFNGENLKKLEYGCKIVVIKNFDNIASNKVDECVKTILELSHRECFSKLNFDIYGDGNYFDELVEPIKEFKNVKFHKEKIIDKNKIYESANIYLNPCVYDMSDSEIESIINRKCYIITSNANIQYNIGNKYIFELKNFIEMANKIEDIMDMDFIKDTKYEQKKSNNNEIELLKSIMNKIYQEIKYVKPINPILTIAIPSYNVEKYLTKCLSSLIYQRNVNKLEVLVINDGSKDKTREIALKFQNKTNGIIQLIDKENGGHGSAVNMGMKLAKGKYFKILDSDDWIKGNELANLIDKMEISGADLILTRVCKEYVPSGNLQVIVDYPKLNEGLEYKFDDLLYDTYGLDYNPLFAACNYKTEKLKQADFSITEKKLYADHEFDAFCLKCIDTVEYYPLDIYMYLIGREGQSVSSEVWRKRYKDHQSAIFTMLEKLKNDKEFKKCRKDYIYRVNVLKMVIHQINTMLELGKTGEISKFIKKLSEYKEAYSVIKPNMLKLDICPLVREALLNKRKSKVKRIIKELLPYCVVNELKKKGIVL